MSTGITREEEAQSATKVGKQMTNNIHQKWVRGRCYANTTRDLSWGDEDGLPLND